MSVESAPALFKVATLDLSRFKSSDQLEREAFARDLVDALKLDGFVKLVNHGISRAMIQDALSISKKFFSLPDNVKRQIEHVPGPYPQRGWSRVGSESTAMLFGALEQSGKKITETDAKEHFDIGPPSDEQFPNRWLDEADVPSMKTYLEDFFERCHGVSQAILSAMEMALELPQGAFTDKCQGQSSELRFNHYPEASMSNAPKDVSRVWPHTDLGVITCLFQDGVGGLEIENRRCDGKFEAVDPNALDELILNISETMERWTNGVVKAGVHNVKLPPALKSSRQGGEELVIPERFSIPFFVKADRDTCVGPLEQFVSETRPPAYPPMTALEYHVKRVAQAY
ncbi:isopenicillin N synthase [Emericellopsis atlantica]|uniref:Isopenicillin N synthase n=1 Tax=Emericellopsis atlantica TaxID=2614577 RepID=A0A9P7ZU31_9HYPO|nr:isopenicillin N synthase [Emericellopsis atlantica]KAG9258280.1 isopenicillin N synthase [Emericellopsis atlantica]